MASRVYDYTVINTKKKITVSQTMKLFILLYCYKLLNVSYYTRTYEKTELK